MSADPFGRAGASSRPSSHALRPLSSGPPTGVFRRIEALTSQVEEIAARRSSSSPPEPVDEEEEGEPENPSAQPDR